MFDSSKSKLDKLMNLDGAKVMRWNCNTVFIFDYFAKVTGW